ncbi:DUF3305 domain-containing protein [Acuticoccus sp. I52.16.1]|uniref:DUF3305 domain-containing protein n=1 Tax=Acuticoccus sp. I52.16.1 TaxID=2928472 RepID=UPI001FD45BB4|nr:DUF3305 domain-containing protein [Acuticoccus sp. I52.16.1]UOM35270.1 DUF3305 domain-containing protein [Acuticoccus sp. I52.16.1]
MDEARAEDAADGPIQSRRARLPVGVVVRRTPGRTRWAKWIYRPVALIPGAPPADWRLMREADGIAEYHAATLSLELHRADVEGYRVSLAMTPPSAFVVMRPSGPRLDDPPHLFAITASAYEAQDHTDSAEQQVEAVPLPDGLAAFVEAFVEAHFADEPFVKRRRDKARVDLVEDGVGDRRIRQLADVYRAPGQQKRSSE